MFSFFLNLPYTIVGVLFGVALFPASVTWDKRHFAIIFRVKADYPQFGYLKGWRAMAIGNAVLLNPRVEDKDLEHELVHVDQFGAYPLIYPALYYWEILTKGYRMNRFEDEAYTKAGNVYRGKK